MGGSNLSGFAGRSPPRLPLRFGCRLRFLLALHTLAPVCYRSTTHTHEGRSQHRARPPCIPSPFPPSPRTPLHACNRTLPAPPRPRLSRVRDRRDRSRRRTHARCLCRLQTLLSLSLSRASSHAVSVVSALRLRVVPHNDRNWRQRQRERRSYTGDAFAAAEAGRDRRGESNG